MSTVNKLLPKESRILFLNKIYYNNNNNNNIKILYQVVVNLILFIHPQEY